MNSRLLHSMSSDSSDLNPLIPEYFLVGHPLTDPVVTEVQIYHLNQFQLLQAMYQILLETELTWLPPSAVATQWIEDSYFKALWRGHHGDAEITFVSVTLKAGQNHCCVSGQRWHHQNHVYQTGWWDAKTIDHQYASSQCKFDLKTHLILTRPPWEDLRRQIRWRIDKLVIYSL